MNERTRIAVEIDAFFGIEEHVLAGIYLENEVLQRPHSHDACHVLLLFLGHILELSQLITGLTGVVYHRSNQFVGVYNRSFTALHLAIRQFNHTVGEVHKLLAPLETKAIKQDRKHLEVIVLLVSYDVNHLIYREILKAHVGRSDVLCHVNRRTIASKQQLLVEPVGCQIGPNAIILLAKEEALGESFLHFFLAFEVGFRLIINLIETHAQGLIGFIEAGIDPVIHLFPKRTHRFVALFPLHQHLPGLFDEGCFGLCFLHGSVFREAFLHVTGLQFIAFGLVMTVECHVEITYQVVAFLAGLFGCYTVSPLQPRQHRLANMNASVVNDVRFNHLVTVGFHDFCQRPAQKIVAHVA